MSEEKDSSTGGIKDSLQDMLYKEIIDDYKDKLNSLKGASATDNLKEITETNVALAETYFSVNDMQSALYHYNQAAICEETLDDWVERVKIFEKMGEIYTLTSKWDNAIKCFRSAKEIAEQNQDESDKWARKINEIYHGLGRVYWRKGSYEKAEHFIMKGINISTERDLTMSNNYVELANMVGEQGQVEKAVEFYNIALEILLEIGDLYHQSRIFNNLADVYLQDGQLDLAMEYVEKCIENSKVTQNKRLLGYGYVNGAETLARQKKLEKALEYTKKGEEIFMEMEEPYSLGFVAQVYAIIFREQKDYERSKEKLEAATGYYVQAGIPYYEAKATFELAIVEDLMGNTTKAMKLASQALEIWTNLKAEERIKEVEEFLEKIRK